MTVPTQEDIDTFLAFEQKIRDVVELIATHLEKDHRSGVRSRNIVEIHPNVWQFQHSHTSQRNESFSQKERIGLPVLMATDPLSTFLQEKKEAQESQAQREQDSKAAWETTFKNLVGEWETHSGFTWEDLYLSEVYWTNEGKVLPPPPTPELLARYEAATDSFFQFTRDVILPTRKALADTWGVSEGPFTTLPHTVLA